MSTTEYAALVQRIAAHEPCSGYSISRILSALDVEQLDLVIAAHREEIERCAARLFLTDVLDAIEAQENHKCTLERDTRCGFLSAQEDPS